MRRSGRTFVLQREEEGELSVELVDGGLLLLDGRVVALHLTVQLRLLPAQPISFHTIDRTLIESAKGKGKGQGEKGRTILGRARRLHMPASSPGSSSRRSGACCARLSAP